MDLSISFLLLYQGINTLLNWSLVLIQRAHLAGSFVGTFCVSLTLVDSFFTTVVLAIYGLQDFMLFGVRFTRHHICLLVQIVGFVYSVLHWPVVFASALDHYGSSPVGQERRGKAWRLRHTACVGMLWASALLYVFLGPSLHPALDDSPHVLLDRCQTQSSPENSQISVALLVTVGCIMLYAKVMSSTDSNSAEEEEQPSRERRRQREHSRMGLLEQAVITFTKTWAAFLILVIAVLALRKHVPSHLTMNVPWLCFLNSFLISVCLCTHYQQLKANKISRLTDGFCQWDLTFAEGSMT
ncbi:hypothetical protein ACEWY4_006398 [Coilia grayii]|uniref:G-protein coupled receptor 160 n=1 Tax=Coilia grayii TaxID=363190 RepID=A0ABD1KDP6_9TELE